MGKRLHSSKGNIRGIFWANYGASFGRCGGFQQHHILHIESFSEIVNPIRKYTTKEDNVMRRAISSPERLSYTSFSCNR